MNRSEQLYKAFAETIQNRSRADLLKAASDAAGRMEWQKVYPQTRTFFNALAEKLTEIERQG